MFRFALIPLFFLFGGLFFSLFAFIVYRKIKRGVKYTIDKSSEISSQYIDKYKSHEQRKQFPKIVQNGFDDYDSIEQSIENLSPIWQLKLLPLKKKANHVLTEISQSLIEDSNFEQKKLPFIRSFFTQSLDAFKQFASKLQSDQDSLTDDETQKAEENIQLIYDDLLHHEELMRNKRKFEFDVLMDVIKARLKK